MIYRDYVVSLCIYFLLSLLALHSIIILNGTIGFFHDWPFGPYEEMTQSYSNDGLYSWDSQYGPHIYSTDWILKLILIPFSPFINGEILTKGILIFTMTLSAFGAFSLAKYLHLRSSSSFVAGLVFIFSPIFFTRIVAGYVYYLIGYSLSPLILLTFLKGKEQNSYKYFVISGLILSAVIQIQFFVMLLIVLFIFIINEHKNVKRGLAGIGVAFSVVLLVTFSPIIISLYYGSINLPTIPVSLFSYHEITFASNLLDSLRFLGYDAHPYSYNNLVKSDILPNYMLLLNYLFPLIGFSSLFFMKYRKYSVPLVAISLIGIFFLKGLNPPFSETFKFLLSNGLYVFREVWHTAFFYGFSMSFLIAFVIDRIITSKYLKKYYRASLSIVLIFVILFSNGYPLLTSNFGGFVQTYNFPPNYHTLYKSLSKNVTNNVLILPNTIPVKFDDLKQEGKDPFLLYLPNNIFPSIIDPSYSTTALSTWLTSIILENKTNSFGSLLSGFGIKYVILRNDFTSTYPNYQPLGLIQEFRDKWFRSHEPFFDSQKDLFPIIKTDNYTVYQNKHNSTKIFIPSIIVGGLTDFNSLLLASNILPLSNVAAYSSKDNDSLVFSDTIKEKDAPFSKFLDIGRFNSSLNAFDGWSSNRYWFGYDYLLSSRVPTGAFTMSNTSKLDVQIPVIYNNKSIEIWLKAAAWDVGGNIGVSINNDEKKYSLYSNNQTFELIKLWDGPYNATDKITIKNINGENYLEGLYIIDADNLTNNANNFLNTSNMIVGIEDKYENNLIQNSNFRQYSADNIVDGIPVINSNNQFLLYLDDWYDAFSTCDIIYECKIDFSEGWLNAGENTANNISAITNNTSQFNNMQQLSNQIKTCVLNGNTKELCINEFMPSQFNRGNTLSGQQIVDPNFGDGSSSLRLSTKSNNNFTFSSLFGKEIENVYPGEHYEFITHMKLNEFATQSHVSLEGFDELSNTWVQLYQCPSGINGPLNWTMFKCEIYLPTADFRNPYNLYISKLRPVINAGWSDTGGKTATSWFDMITLKKVNANYMDNDSLVPILSQKISTNTLVPNATVKELNKINPTLWNVKVDAKKPFILAFAEQYNPAWEAKIFRNGSLIETEKSVSLYGSINSFKVDHRGDLEITIRYTNQNGYEMGMVISGISFFICLLYIFGGKRLLLKGIKK
jgi:hypothetical protein